MSQRTKHITIKYHHFKEHAKKGLISINAIDSKEQIADISTKGLYAITIKYLQGYLMGW